MKTRSQLAEINAKKGVLTELQVLSIREGLRKGERPADIAALYGVSEQTITRIRDGRTWFWLKDMPVTQIAVSEQDAAGAEASFARLKAELEKTGEGDKLIRELKGENDGKV